MRSRVCVCVCAGLVLALGRLSDHSRRRFLLQDRRRRGRQQQGNEGQHEQEEEEEEDTAPASPTKEPGGGGGVSLSLPSPALAGAIARLYRDDLFPLLPLAAATTGVQCSAWGRGVGRFRRNDRPTNPHTHSLTHRQPGATAAGSSSFSSTTSIRARLLHHLSSLAR